MLSVLFFWLWDLVALGTYCLLSSFSRIVIVGRFQVGPGDLVPNFVQSRKIGRPIFEILYGCPHTAAQYPYPDFFLTENTRIGYYGPWCSFFSTGISVLHLGTHT